MWGAANYLSHSSNESGQDSHSHAMARTFRPGNGLNQASSLQYPGLLPEILLFFFTLSMYCPATYSGAPSVCQEASGCDVPACFRQPAAAPSCGSWEARAPQGSPILWSGEPDAFIFNTIKGCEKWQFEGTSMSSISVAL